MLSKYAGKSFYFLGIGGVSMSALARLLRDLGFRVRGSDGKESSLTQSLRASGIPVSITENEEITEDVVVYTGAVLSEHPQFKAAQKAGKRLIARAAFLGEIAEEYPQVVSVAGCHGKTSTTAMLAHILYRAKRKFTCHIGGEDAQLGNYYAAGREIFLTEACEFQRSFLALKSSIAIILNTDRDHTDCYQSDEDLLDAYRAFSAQSEKTILCAEDIHARTITSTRTFGLQSGDIWAENLSADRERYAFTVVENYIPLVRIRLEVTGKFQILNALAAFSAARLLGLTPQKIKEGIEDFRGVKRRFEQIGTISSVPVVCDYAHHPREIEATLKSAEKLCRGTVRVVFQPHTYTRTRDFMNEFIRVLKRAERPIIYKTFAAREPYDQSGSAVTLAANLPDAVYVQSGAHLKSRLEEGLERDDLILILGAGDVYDIAKQIID